jgi:hypothetical protein
MGQGHSPEDGMLHNCHCPHCNSLTNYWCWNAIVIAVRYVSELFCVCPNRTFLWGILEHMWCWHICNAVVPVCWSWKELH